MDLKLIHAFSWQNNTKCNKLVVFNLIRILDSSRGNVVLMRTTTLPSARGVGSRTKEASGARSRSFSRRSKREKRTRGFRFTPKTTFKASNSSGLFLSYRSSDEKKEKGGEKTPEKQNNSENESSGKNPKLVHVEINRGTAVWAASLTQTLQTSSFSQLL